MKVRQAGRVAPVELDSYVLCVCVNDILIFYHFFFLLDGKIIEISKTNVFLYAFPPFHLSTNTLISSI